ncbi:unnamed protein product [Phytophthora fragariaefolia]|uniref:Unnamed protein product n=1 Tax=Phytophthora fragariaefolia TaxID=1490495 RepID=A0A9W6XH41_9STRA|nr:unnamed protein product [Phytophthora fragariaefolia]
MMTARQNVFIALLASAVSLSVVAVACELTVFPLPLGPLIVAVPLIGLIQTYHMRVVGHHLRADEALRADTKRIVAGIQCMLILPFIYPLYIYGFVSLSEIWQAMFVGVLQVIKLIAKNWINATLYERDDIKPEMVIISVEIVNSFYVSSALQSTSSWTTTITVMVSDLAGFWLSMVDVAKVFNEINVLMGKIPQNHPLATEKKIQMVTRILDENEASKGAHQKTQGAAFSNITDLKSVGGTNPNRSFTCTCTWPDINAAQATRMPVEVPKRKLFPSSSVVPIRTPQKQLGAPQTTKKSRALPSMGLSNCTDVSTIFSREERSLLIRKSMHVLFITESIVLLEYVEVMAPIVYCMRNLSV